MTRRLDSRSDANYTWGRIPNGAQSSLTERERAILRFVAAGMSNREIAEELTLSPTTIKWYLEQIFIKLGAHRRTQAVKMASDLHLMDIASPQYDPKAAIPKPAIMLIGREKDVNEIISLLNETAVRLVTILRPGGLGKTQLALEVAQQLAGHQPRHVCFVALDSIDSLSGVIRAVDEAKGEYKTKADLPRNELRQIAHEMEKQMKEAAKNLEFERAAALRDELFELKSLLAEDEKLKPWERIKLLSGEEE